MREDPVDAQLGADGVRDGFGVAGDHDHLDTQLVQGIDGFTGLGADLVGELEPADDFSVPGHVQDDRALATPRVRRVDLAGTDVLEQTGTADTDLRTVDGRGDTDRRGRGKPGRLRQGQVLVLRGANDGPSERVLTVGLGRRGDREHLVSVQVTDRFHGGDGGLALGEGAGLVEQHGVDGAHALEREPVLHQHPATGGALSGDGHHQRDRQAQRVRAGDDQHGDGAHDRRIGIADDSPHHRGDRGGAQREPEQQRRRLVGDPLRPRGRVLCLRDQPLNTREGGLIPRGGDLHAKAGVCGDGARGNGVASAAGDGAGFTGDHGLVHVGAAVDDLPVGGDAAAGADHHHVPDLQVGG